MLGFIILMMLCRCYMVLVACLLYGLWICRNILLKMPFFLLLRGKKQKTAKTATAKTTH